MATVKISLGRGGHRIDPRKALRNLERKKYQYDLRTYGHAVRLRDVRAEEQFQFMNRLFGGMRGEE